MSLSNVSSDGGFVDFLTDDGDDDDEKGVNTEDYMTPEEKLRKMIEMKGMRLLGDETKWRESVRQKMESELTRRVREALDSPPSERVHKRAAVNSQQRVSPDLNAHLLSDLTNKYGDLTRAKRCKSLQGDSNREPAILQNTKESELYLQDKLPASDLNDERLNDIRVERLAGETTSSIYDYNLPEVSFPGYKSKLHQFNTKESYLRALRTGYLPDGVQISEDCRKYVDKYGVVRDKDGPFWPAEFVPLFATPRFKWWANFTPEPLYSLLFCTSQTVEGQLTQYKGKWRGVQLVFDCERSHREASPPPVPEGCCPALMFESRFECGNLRQAKRVGHYEYELTLKTDLYTTRHTQWYYFRVNNAVPGITYKFKIINLLKRDSLYNYGMRPLMYSEHDAREKQRGWIRTGHHISYTRSNNAHTCPLLERGVTYHVLEWQMEFPNADDTFYLAHCYPYSFTDLKEDLELLLNNEERSKVTRREVMCETRAGNSCFLLTVTNFEGNEEKKAVVLTARVHPGESQSSWMMKGLLEFITGPDPAAKELRNKFVFKVVPMINPDGVIVGNYRCSLAGRDLNRNYRHPRRDNFPTIWYLKNMVLELARKHEIALYCDLHGHSRKPNVFMYGNNTSSDVDSSPINSVRAFISERLFPWLMSVRSPDKFHFKSCKFQIRRCKEATGRVVMWRQMRVLNSFTLEATFSGTVLDRENSRHFNIQDFMDMGKVLAQTIIDYQEVFNDPGKQIQVVLALTRVIAEQVLTSKGLLLPGHSLTDITRSGQGTDLNTSQEPLTKKNLPDNPVQTTQGGVSSETKETSLTLKKEVPSSVASQDDVVSITERLACGRTLDDCLELLAQMDVQNNLQESDSSDSDSESEPEMRSLETKSRKKKRKSKKQRDKDNERRYTGTVSDSRKSSDGRVKSAFPSLNATYRQDVSQSSLMYNENSILWHTKQVTAERYATARCAPGFVSKYEGRHNGGLPCFTEERSLERAAKRVEELRRKCDDTKESENGFYGEDKIDLLDSPQQETLTQRLYNFQTNGPRGIQPLTVRTRYIHAEALQERCMSTFQPANSFNTRQKNTLQIHTYRHGKEKQDASLTNGSEFNNEQLKHQLPLAVRTSPYHQSEPLCPRPVSEFTFIRHSYATPTSSVPISVATSSSSSLPAKTGLSSSTTTAAATTTANLLPKSATPYVISRGQNLISPLTVSSLPKATSSKSASHIRSPSSIHKCQETSLDHQNEPKLKPIITTSQPKHENLTNSKASGASKDLANSKSQKDNLANKTAISALSDVVRKPVKSGIARESRNPQSDSENQRHFSPGFESPYKSLNLGHLVNHLAQNLLGVSSTLSTSKSQLALRNDQLRTLVRSNHKLKTSADTSGPALASSNHAILSDNFTANTVNTTSRPGLRLRTEDH